MADNKPVPKPPSEEAFRQLVALQTQELQIRSRKYELRQAELNHSAKYAEKALDAEIEDRKDERESHRRHSNARNTTVVAITAAVLIFAGWALYLNKDAIVLEALKIAGTAAVSFGGGYYYGKSKSGGKAAPARPSALRLNCVGQAAPTPLAA